MRTLRRYIADLPPEHRGWLAGARDPVIGKAFALLHKQTAHPWTIAELADSAGVSRSVLAERFREYVGEAPMAYLARWRMQVAARMLSNGNQGVAQIATQVGYDSEAAFNRAFKPEFGAPPARFRKLAKSPSGARAATPE